MTFKIPRAAIDALSRASTAGEGERDFLVVAATYAGIVHVFRKFHSSHPERIMARRLPSVVVCRYRHIIVCRFRHVDSEGHIVLVLDEKILFIGGAITGENCHRGDRHDSPTK